MKSVLRVTVLDVKRLSPDEIVLQRKRLKRELLATHGLKDIRISVLSGSTINEVVDLLEILLLRDGFRAEFQLCEYGRYWEDAVLEPQAIAAFKPNIVYLHTSEVNLRGRPPLACTESGFKNHVEIEFERWRAIWSSLESHVGMQIIQNNFELPAVALLGHLDAVSPGGATRFINELNIRFAAAARDNPKLIVQDLASLAARVGLNHWSDPDRWFSYKIATTVEGSFAIATSLASLVRAMFGRARKVLVLDLDNTLWGGVIGDDGVDGIVLGRETPEAEAYIAFQEYCLALRTRGVLLAVCSKNDKANAKAGFSHPDSVLKLEHFSAFKANWEPKHDSILAIAAELTLNGDSFVFVDDNPAERAIVEAQIPGIAVPDVGSEISRFINIVEAERYFEPLNLSKEDLERAKLYEENAQRATQHARFADYGEYLDSLEMTAEIELFRPAYIERITQLTNKSNQFNLTARRYTHAEMEEASRDPNRIGIYGRLTDRFGDNGLVSVVLGSIEGAELHLDLWLMSCRVLKREMEIAMLDGVALRAMVRGLKTLVGRYLPTAKNAMVADHYANLGFLAMRNEAAGAKVWSLDLTAYKARSRHIRILDLADV